MQISVKTDAGRTIILEASNPDGTTGSIKTNTTQDRITLEVGSSDNDLSVGGLHLELRLGKKMQILVWNQIGQTITLVESFQEGPTIGEFARKIIENNSKLNLVPV